MAGIQSLGGVVIPISIVRTGDKAAIKNLERELGQLSGVVAQTTANSKEAASQWVTSSKFVNTLNKELNALRWTMVNVGFGITFLGALAAPFVLASKEAMKFENQLRKIQSVTGASVVDSAATILTARSGRPVDKNEVAEGFLEFSKAGYSAEESAYALNSVIDLAQIGTMDLSKAAGVLTQTLSQFNLNADQSGMIVDRLSSAADGSRASVEGLALSLSYVGPIAEGLNQDLGGTIDALSLLADAGLDNSKAGTGMRQVFAALLDPSKKAQERMNQLGVSFIDSSGNAKQLSSFLIELNSSLKNLDEGTRKQILADMFEVRALTTVDAFLNKIEEIPGIFDQINTSNSKASAGFIKARQQELSQMSGLKSAVEDFKDSWIETGNVINNDILPGLISRLTDLTDTINDASRGLNKLKISPGADKGIADIWENPDVPKWVKDGIQVPLALGGAMDTFTLGMFGGPTDKGVDRELELRSAAKEKAYLDQIGILRYEEYSTASEILSLYQKFPNIQQQITTALGESGSATYAIYQDTLRLQAARDGLLSAYEKSVVLQKELRKSGDDEGANRMDATGLEYLKLASEYTEELNSNLRFLDSSSTQNFNRELQDTLTLFGRLESALVTSKEYGDEFFDGLVGKTDKLSDKLKVYYDFLNSTKGLASSPIVQQNAPKEASDFLGTYEDSIKQYEILKETERAIEQLTARKTELESAIDSISRSLKNEQKELQSLNEELRETDKRISDITGSRFTGESDILAILRKSENYRKKQELASLGVADASEFIHEALQLELGDYDQLFEKLSRINSEMERNQNTFEAWQQTIKTAIETEISAGQNLSTDVTNRVKQWQTALLSTSQFSNNDSGSTQFDDFINKLQLAYDVQYGGMRDEVTNFLDAQRDSEVGVFDTSTQLITALQLEISERERLQQAIYEQTEVVDRWSKNLESKTLKLQSVLDNIASKKDAIQSTMTNIANLGNAASSAVSSIKAAVNKLTVNQNHNTSNSNGTTSFNTANLSRSVVELASMDRGFSSVAKEAIGQNRDGSLIYGDFISRPGQATAQFSPDDTVIGVKDTSMLGNTSVSIGNITINGYNKDPEELAYEVAQAIARELNAR